MSLDQDTVKNTFLLERSGFMAKLCRPLTDTQIKNIKTGPKKYFDGGGLFLYVSRSGSELWRLSYQINGKETTTSFGSYPLI